MIVRERKHDSKRFPYGKLFLAMEAPEDEPPRRNMKTVVVKPNQRARLDFTNNLVVDDIPQDETDTLAADEIPDDITFDEPEVGGDAEPNVETDDVPEDITFDEPGQTQTPDTEVPDDIDFTANEPDEDDTAVDLDNVDYTDDQNQEAEPETVTVGGDENQPDDTTDYTQDEGNGNTEPPVIDNPPDDTDDTTDYTDTNTDDTSQNTDDGGTTGGEEKGPGLEYDSVRQYNLFKEFMKLRNAIDTYITKLEGYISDEPGSNLIIKKATTKFRDLYSLITDYMLMKFELCTYVQNMLFFEKQVASVTLIFKLLRTTDELYSNHLNRKEGKRIRKK